MKRFFIAFTLFSVLFYAGCRDIQTEAPSQSQEQKQGFETTDIVKSPLKVVTSFYPLYKMVQQVGGAHVTVANLVPAGSEPHDYEPTPQDVVRLNQADLVVYNGIGFEPWADKIFPELQKNGVKILNISDALKGEILPAVESHEDEHGAEDHEEEKHENLNDPHIWLDPLNYQQEVQAVTQKLVELDPAHQTDYEKNSQNFIRQLQDLDIAYQNGLKNCRQQEFVTNHSAFGYLAKRYHLTMIPISGLSPDTEPSAKIIADLVQVIKEKKIRYILTESLVSPKIADTLANETGAQTLVLNPLEGLTDEEIAQGKNYVSVMQDNLKNLRTALEC